MEQSENIDFIDHRYAGWIKLSLIYLIITGILGVIMRLAFVFDFPEFIDYRYILHTHSHLAMMGWVYNGLYVFLIVAFGWKDRIFNRVFWLTQLCIWGMLLSFPVQGYGLISIIFTSGHMILSYIFAYHGYKKLRQEKRSAYSTFLIKTAFFFLILSTLGTWALGYIMNSPLRGSAVYYGSIQFFLHFQFNGWFIFGIMGILCRFLEERKLLGSHPRAGIFYWLLVVSCFSTFALAVTWSTPLIMIFWTNSFGVLLQLAALYYLWVIVRSVLPKVKEHLHPQVFHLWLTGGICLILKILIQALVAIPYLATVSYTIKHFVIGFIHLLMLGSITTFLLGFIQLFSKARSEKQNWGITIFLTGFLLSEAILFLQGFLLLLKLGFMPAYYILILIFSVLMPFGILIYASKLKLNIRKN